MLYGFTPVG